MLLLIVYLIHQAIYPTIIIVLVALKRSPIDNGALSQVRRARGQDSEAAEGGMSSTIVFHQSVFHSCAGDLEEMDGTTESIPTGDRRSTHSLETSMREAETKTVGNFA